MRYSAIMAAVATAVLTGGIAQAQTGFRAYQSQYGPAGSAVRLTSLQESSPSDPLAVPIPQEGEILYGSAPAAATSSVAGDSPSCDSQPRCATGVCGSTSCGTCGPRLHHQQGRSCGNASCGTCGLGRLHRHTAASCGAGGCGIGGCGIMSGAAGGGAIASVVGNQQCGSNWFGGLYGLIFNRDDDNRGKVLGYDDSNLLVPGLSTGMARSDNAGGFETRFGRMLGNNTAFEAVYWGIFPEPVRARLIGGLIPGNADSAITFTGLQYDNGGGAQPVDNFFQDTSMLEVRRDWEVNNVEINLLRLPFTLNNKSRLALLAGGRYIRADDSLFFGADSTGANFGDDPLNELAYEVDIKNELTGFQVGGMFDYAFTCRLYGHVNSKFGLFGNRMEMHHCLKNGNGTPVEVATGPYAGEVYYLTSEKNDMAFLGELDAGLSYAIRPCWRVTAGYRVVALSGLAMSTSQIPTDFTDLASVADISNNDSMILHGAYIGSEFAW